MISIQVVARTGENAYELLRQKVTHEARTGSWADSTKTRLQHTRLEAGYIEVASADSVLVAHIHPKTKQDEYFLAEKFIGRLTAWFADQIVAVNLQFLPDSRRSSRSRR